MIIKPVFNLLSAILSVTAISISVYFNINPAYKTFDLVPGQTKVIDQNMGYGTMHYNIDIESKFKVKDQVAFPFLLGTEFNMVYLGDTVLLHYTSYGNNETLSIELPQNAMLIVSCSVDIVGYAKCSIRERKTFPQKQYSFVPGYSDTAKMFIQSGKEKPIYENNTSSTVLLRVFVSNHFKKNLEGKSFLPFSDEVILYVKRTNEDERIVKPLKQREYLQTGQNKTFDYSLLPGYSLNIKTFDKELTGYCYFQKVSLAF
jgi:hypothetical protein